MTSISCFTEIYLHSSLDQIYNFRFIILNLPYYKAVNLLFLISSLLSIGYFETSVIRKRNLSKSFLYVFKFPACYAASAVTSSDLS